MAAPLPPIDWIGTTADVGYQHEEGTTPEGTFLLDHPGEDGLVRVKFQWPMPAGMDIDAHMDALSAARRAAPTGSRAYWRAAGTYPHTGTDQGYFASHAMAHALIEGAGHASVNPDIAAALAAAGFTGRGEHWERKARCGRLVITLLGECMHLRFERRGSQHWTNLVRLWLSKPGHVGTVYANWPDYLASLPALVAVAIAAADYADAEGLTAPKARRAKAA